MRYPLLFCTFLISLSCFSSIHAQTIIKDLETPSAGEGTIGIVCDPRITELVGNPSLHLNRDEGSYIKMNGYRILVFMGNNPRTAKGEVHHKQSMIRESFPETATYVTYIAPNWKLLAGDFASKDEAAVFKQKIIKVFPEFGKEMFIVPDEIRVLVEK